MDANLVMIGTGLGIQTVTCVLQAYSTLRRSNIEKYFERLVEAEKDLAIIEKDSELKRKLFTIIEKVSREFNLKKIERWKNATIHLATDFADFDFNDNLIRALDDLTVFDLTVLQVVYSTDFSKEHFESEVIEYFKRRKAPEHVVRQSVKRLASHDLVTEMVNRVGVFGNGDGTPYLGPLYYVKNDLGSLFIRFISEDFSSDK